MGRPRGIPLTQITLSPPTELVERLRAYAERHNVAMVRVVEVALRRFFEAEEWSRVGPAKRAPKRVVT